MDTTMTTQRIVTHTTRAQYTMPCQECGSAIRMHDTVATIAIAPALGGSAWCCGPCAAKPDGGAGLEAVVRTALGTLCQPARFKLGQVVLTPGIADLVEAGTVNPAALLARHARGDWGDANDANDADKQANDADLAQGGRLLSAYDVTPGLRVWIITEGEDDKGYRQATTILLPDEY